MDSAGSGPLPDGLSLRPFRGLRPRPDGAELAELLCPPYDVIDASLRAELLARNPDNAVAVILPEPTDAGYASAADRLARAVESGALAVDAEPVLYVYEMVTSDGQSTRGLLGAVELRAPEDGVILPHENTMAGPVADRLAVMTTTGTDLEPIYLLYDGGGAASDVLAVVDQADPIAGTHTPDGMTHRLWAIEDPDTLAAVAADLAGRRALIADGHHRYATYRERQRTRREVDGPGPWDHGLALLVDSSRYGPQVHAIHRVVPGLSLDRAAAGLESQAGLSKLEGVAEGLVGVGTEDEPFRVVLSDGLKSLVVTDPDGRLAAAAHRPGEPPSLAGLDVTIVHRALVERAWGLPDDIEHVGFAHTVDEAVESARRSDGVAVLMRATPAAAVAAVAAEGARMPRKSTLFTPKPASGLVMRRLVDQAR